MMIVTMMSFGSVMVFTFLPKFTPYTLLQLTNITEQSPARMINASLIVQGVFNLFLFLVPAWLFSYLAHPQPAGYLGLRAPGRKIQWLLVICLMLGAIPLLELLQSLIGLINFGPKIKASQEASNHLYGAFLTIPDLSAFIRTFVIMAIFPAFGEEMFFRGVMMRFAKKRSRTMSFPVFFTAVIFAYAHSNIYGFLSIFFAGVLLACIYYLTGSLWCSILAHLVFNGSQVILSYAGKNNAGVKTFLDNNTVSVFLVIGGAIVFSYSLYLLIKNKTPLPDNWTDDFPPVGPAEGDWDFISQNKN